MGNSDFLTFALCPQVSGPFVEFVENFVAKTTPFKKLDKEKLRR